MLAAINDSLSPLWYLRERCYEFVGVDCKDSRYEAFIDLIQISNLSLAGYLKAKQISSLFIVYPVTHIDKAINYFVADEKIRESITKISRRCRVVLHGSITALIVIGQIFKNGLSPLILQSTYLIASSFLPQLLKKITILNNEYAYPITSIALSAMEVITSLYSPLTYLKIAYIALHVISFIDLLKNVGTFDNLIAVLHSPESTSIFGRYYLFSEGHKDLDLPFEELEVPDRELNLQEIYYAFSKVKIENIYEGFPINFLSQNQTIVEYWIHHREKHIHILTALFPDSFSNLFLNHDFFSSDFSWKTHREECIEKLRFHFVSKWHEPDTLESLWLFGRNELLYLVKEQIINQLGEKQGNQTLQRNYQHLQRKYPNHPVSLDQRTVLEVPSVLPRAPGNPNIEELLNCFDEIHFSNPSQGIEKGSVDIRSLFYDDSFQKVPGNGEKELKINRDWLKRKLRVLIDGINQPMNHLIILRDPIERRRFYDTLTKQLQYILAYCQSDDANPVQKANILCQLALAGAHCLGRWREAIDTSASICINTVPLTTSQRILNFLYYFRVDIIQNGVGKGSNHYPFYPYDEFSPHNNYQTRYKLAPFIGVLDRNNIKEYGNLHRINVVEHLQQFFTRGYTPDRILDLIEGKISNPTAGFSENEVDNWFHKHFTLDELSSYYSEVRKNWVDDILDLNETFDYIPKPQDKKLALLKSSNSDEDGNPLLKADGTPLYRWSGHYNRKAVALMLTKMGIFTHNPLIDYQR